MEERIEESIEQRYFRYYARQCIDTLYNQLSQETAEKKELAVFFTLLAQVYQTLWKTAAPKEKIEELVFFAYGGPHHIYALFDKQEEQVMIELEKVCAFYEERKKKEHII